MKLLSYIKEPKYIALLALCLVTILLSLIENSFLFESITRILILTGLFCGYLSLSKNRKFLFTLQLVFPLLIATIFLLYLIIAKGAKPDLQVILLLHGVAMVAYGVGLALRFLKINPLYKIVILQGFIILFILGTSRRYGVGWYAVCTMMAFILTSIYLGSHKPDKPLRISLILLATVLLIPLLDSSNIGIAIYTPFTLLGGVFSHLTLQQMMKTENSFIKRFSPLLIFIFLSPFIWVVQENYSYSLYALNNATLGESEHLNLLDKEGIQIQANQDQTSVYLFWSASCGNCRKEFPYFSDLALKYKDHTNIKFYAVLIQFKVTDSIAFNYEVKNEFAFDWARSPDGQSVYQNLIRTGFPCITIIGKDKKILYNGFVINRPWLYFNHPDRYLN